MTTTAEQVRAAILLLVESRGPEKTICPSEAARHLIAEDWRALMPLVREQAFALARSGQIVVMQRGQVILPEDAKGAIRLACPKQS